MTNSSTDGRGWNECVVKLLCVVIAHQGWAAQDGVYREQCNNSKDIWCQGSITGDYRSCSYSHVCWPERSVLGLMHLVECASLNESRMS